MRLSDGEILAEIRAGNIKVDPTPNDNRIAGAAIDLTLGSTFRLFEGDHQVTAINLAGDPTEVAAQVDIVMGDPKKLDRLVLHPGELAIGITEESISIPVDMVGTLNGRSSLARLGLSVHVTAHEIDPGWIGPIALEFINSGRVPLVLVPGMRICALGFNRLGTPALRPYGSRPDAKYRRQIGPDASRIGSDGVDSA